MTPFAEMQLLLNDAVIGQLSDAEADLGNGVTLAGLFRNPAAEVFSGLVTGSRPTFECKNDAAPATGTAMSINGVTYLVVRVLPDGAGMAVLELDKQ